MIAKQAMPLLADSAAAMDQALAQPVGCPALAEEAARAESACILICDFTRPVPNGVILPPLIRTLLSAGMAPEQITVLVATGLHRPNEGEELAALVGDPWVLETVNVANHFAREDADHVLVGTTERGTVVRLDRRFMEADLRIATGLVEPHFMAGWSGGRKVIAPGVAHAETITTFHSARFMEHPNCTNCVLEGNPLHEEQLAIMAMIGGARAVNSVIDDERRVAFLNYGEVVASHAAAVAFAEQFCTVPVAERFSTVLTSSAGYPLDATYYQTVKGMVGPLEILAPGATSSSRPPAPRGWARRTTRMRSAAWWRTARSTSSTRSAPRPTPRSTSGRPRCSFARCGPARSTFTPRALRPKTGRSPESA